MKNDYTTLIGLFREEGAKYNPPMLSIAQIQTPLPSLSIKVRDLIVTKDNLLIADDLLPYKRGMTMKGKIQARTENSSGGGGYEAFASHGHLIAGETSLEGEMNMKDNLKVGDQVIVYPLQEGQTYMILCKVVNV